MLFTQTVMLPLQSPDGSTPHPPGAPPGPLSASETGENRQQKPKTLPCKYCSKRFRRVEHVQRHERTHTKEKPFQCQWDRCGKTFGRRDLLVRHEKLVHLNENSKDNTRPRKLSSSTTHQSSLSDGNGDGGSMGILRPGGPQAQAPPQQTPQHQHPHLQGFQRQPLQQPSYHQSHIPQPGGNAVSHDPRAASRTAAACNLDLLSDAALASEVHPIQSMMGDASQQHHPQLPQPQSQQSQTHGQHQGHSRVKGYSVDGTGHYSERPRDDQPPVQTAFVQPLAQQVSYDDYNVFLDDFAPTQHFLPPHFEPDQLLGSLMRSPGNVGRGISKAGSQYPSRYNSLAPDHRDTNDLNNESTRSQLLRISIADHNTIKARLDEFTSVLPKDFVFPSRHTLTRFLEGYVSGFHEHLPFLHLPTLSPIDMAPELLLAMLAVGAQYRFESNRGYALWYAAKTVALEQVRRRHSSEMNALLPTPAAYSPHSTRPSPNTTYRHSFASAQSERPITQDTHREPYSPNTAQARLETIQAVLLLFAIGLWGAKTILHEALALQSTLAVLIREEGLSVETSQASLTDWEAWIRLEGATRTKLIAFCFFNLCSAAYSMPPLLFTSELNLYLPLRSRLWRAESAWQWQELRQSTAIAEITVHEAFSRLFGRTNQVVPSQLSSLGNYVLIHALLQHVFLLKQTSFSAGSPYNTHRTLKHEDVEEVTGALRVWQTSFEHRHQLRAAESGHFAGTDSIPGGSLAYNASALLRLAYIRLYTDLPPSRALDTRDYMLVASGLSNTPPLMRSLRLHRAVFQAVHALSMLVKAGVKYVAKTKSSEWSIQHSLCNFECAILLAKWLLTLGSIGPSDTPASSEEKNLLETVRRMLDETEFAVPVDPSLSGPSPGSGQMEMATSDSAKLRQLACAVVRLWAETFKGAHVFEMVKVMGSSLDGYADLIEKPRERTTPLGRMAPEPGIV